MITILSIDGGGIRGVIPARIIIEIENILKVKLNKQKIDISDYFDLIAGSSTGAILALLYSLPDHPDSSEILNIYYDNGKKIFKTNFWKRITFGLFSEKYETKSIKDTLKKYFSDFKLSDLKKDCLVTAFDMEQYRSIFFTNPKSDDKDFKLVDVALSSSAAPTYFDPYPMESVDKTNKHVNVDGGLFANNPAMCAMVEACKNYECDLDDITIVSIGTGMKCEQSLSISYEKAKKWGLIKWIKPLINIMMYGTSNIVHHQLKILFSYLNSDYYRLQPVFNVKDQKDISLEMDDASKNNIEALLLKTENYIVENYSKLIEVADKLIELYDEKNS